MFSLPDNHLLPGNRTGGRWPPGGWSDDAENKCSANLSDRDRLAKKHAWV